VRSVRVGLTGGLASGKSTVAGLLARAGFEVLDADRVVAHLYRAGGEGAAAVARIFGADSLDPAGAVDKPKVAKLVFGDESARRRLESEIHPLVRQEFRRLAEEAERPIVLEATRLVEAGYAPDFDLIVSVEAPEELRLQRAVERNLTRAEAVARLTAQGDGAKRREVAHRLIWNDGTLADLEERVAKLVAEIRKRQAERTAE
jgi:dephospho-CoA kinase